MTLEAEKQIHYMLNFLFEGHYGRVVIPESFVPKLFVVLAAMALFAPYTLSALTDYFSFIFEEIATKGF